MEIILFIIKFSIYNIPLIFTIFSVLNISNRDFREKTTEYKVLLLMISLASVTESIIYLSLKKQLQPKEK